MGRFESTSDERRRTKDGRQPSSFAFSLPSFWLWLALLAVLLAAPLCIGLTTLGAQGVDLFHVTVFNSCAFRAYQVHWQDHRRYPDEVRYDFTGSPVSFALVEIWIKDGPTISYSRVIPLGCAARPTP